MKICIPTIDNNGTESRAHGHFGSAPYFAVVDTVTGEIHMETNSGHRHGECNPVSHIARLDVDAVVCHGMGKRALTSLRRGNVDVLITAGETVADVLAEARDGKLRQLSATEACGGHGGRHRGGCSSGEAEW